MPSTSFAALTVRQVAHRRKVRRVPQRPVRSTPARVTVLVPCYNYARFLPQCVGSALSQADVSVDVIVVDDASTDDTRDIARALAREERVEMIESPVNGGPVSAFNRGLAAATGEFVVRLDADDLLAPGAIGRAVALFDEFPSVGLVYGRPLHFRLQPPRSAASRVTSWTIWPGLDWLDLRCRRGVNCITSPEVVMRRSVVDVVGGQRQLEHTHDMEMWMRISAFSDIGHLNGAVQAFHREHPQSRSAEMVGPLVDLRERLMAFEALLSNRTASGVPGRDHLLWRAKRALARDALDRACRSIDRGRTGPARLEELVEFAQTTFPEFRSLGQWRGLQARGYIGFSRVPYLPPFQMRAVSRRVRDELVRAAWSRTGV